MAKKKKSRVDWTQIRCETNVSSDGTARSTRYFVSIPNPDARYNTVHEALHNPNGPARIVQQRGHEVIEYHFKGMLHRDDGPAVIVRNTKTGQIIMLEYFHKGAAIPESAIALLEFMREGQNVPLII